MSTDFFITKKGPFITFEWIMKGKMAIYKADHGTSTVELKTSTAGVTKTEQVMRLLST